MYKELRPKTFEEFVGQPEVVERLKNIINIVLCKDCNGTGRVNGDVCPTCEGLGWRERPPDLLFAGPAGVGKTTAAYIMAREVKARIVEINASDERGIQTIREDVKSQTRMKGRRIIFLDEADALCLHPETEISVLSEGTIEGVPVKELYNKTFRCLSYDGSGVSVDIAKGIKSPDTMLYEMELEDGRKIICSANQPFIVLRNGKLLWVKLKDIKHGDKILTTIR